jgi:hypothetical protein
VFFKPRLNTISSITKIAREYDLDGIDIDYEHFDAETNTFAECIDRLLSHLKEQKIVSIASITPYDNDCATILLGPMEEVWTSNRLC